MNIVIKIKNKLSSLSLMWLLLMFFATLIFISQDGTINKDGLGYLEQATLFLDGKWQQGFSYYPWPFFSLILAILYKITHLHLQFLASFFCLFLFGVATYYYLKILNIVSKKKSVIFYGGLVLASSIPIMDNYLGMILRDHGLWALCMAGTYYFLLDQKKNNFKSSLIWQVCFFVGGLFRPEAFIFLLILPIWLFYKNKELKLSNFIKDYALIIAIFSIALLVMIISNKFSFLIYESRIFELIHRPLHIFSKFFIPLPIETQEPMLQILLDDYKFLIGLCILLSVVFFKWVYVVGFINFILVLLVLFYKNKNIYNKNITNIYFFLTISFLIVLFNTYYVFVLSNRYWVIHLWWINILVAPFLMYIFESRFNLYLKILLGLNFLILILNVLVDKKNDTELNIARYLKENNITSVDYDGHERISYYLNFDPFSFKNYKLNSKFEYKILDAKDTTKYYSNEQLVKKFPEKNTKFLLIKND